MCDDADKPSLHPRRDQNRPVQDFVEAVLVRPTMYTINGTLEEVAVFLQGFYSGIGAHAAPVAEQNARSWFDFCEWAVRSVDDVTGSSWYDLFQALRRQYPGDLDAIDRLFELYTDFRRERGVVAKQ